MKGQDLRTLHKNHWTCEKKSALLADYTALYEKLKPSKKHAIQNPHLFLVASFFINLLFCRNRRRGKPYSLLPCYVLMEVYHAKFSFWILSSASGEKVSKRDKFEFHTIIELPKFTDWITNRDILIIYLCQIFVCFFFRRSNQLYESVPENLDY